MYIYSFSVTYIDKIAITCISFIISIYKKLKATNFFFQKLKQATIKNKIASQNLLRNLR